MFFTPIFMFCLMSKSYKSITQKEIIVINCTLFYYEKNLLHPNTIVHKY